jgi:hypothetical protein
MPTLQFKPGLFGMIEVFCVDFDQRDIAPLMLVVAFFAGLLFFMLTMQPMLAEFILRDFLVAALAQVRLGCLVKVFMTAPAIAFVFGMPLYHRTGQ